MKELKIISKEVLEDAADAIRAKSGSSDPIAPEDFDDAIDSIPSGGEISYTWKGVVNISKTPVVDTETGTITKMNHGLTVGDHIEIIGRVTGAGTLNTNYYLVRGEVTTVTSGNAFKITPSYVKEDVTYLSSNTMNITENGTYEVYQYKGVVVNTPSALMLGWTGDHWVGEGEWTQLPSEEPTPVGRLAELSIYEGGQEHPTPAEGDVVIACGTSNGNHVIVAGTVYNYKQGAKQENSLLTITVAAMSNA